MWRSLRRLVDAGRLEVVGKGRATRYRAVGREVVLAHLDVPASMRQPMPYRPEFAGGYIPNESRYLTDADRAELRKAGTPVLDPFLAAQGVTFARRVLEELEIDMSWASSRLEGNSYDLLETDRLIRYARESPGKPGRDAMMILNHRNAIRYVVENLDEIGIGWPDLRNIHALLSHGLIPDPTLRGGLRRLPVAIGKSAYRPLEDRFTLQEEFDALVSRAERISDPFEQSFFLLVHIPYLQPFADVNKRTSRIAALIPLLKADLAPMSFFGINDREYIRGLIGVYELNDVSLMREAFVNGYIATARTVPVPATCSDQSREGRPGVPFLHEPCDATLRPQVACIRTDASPSHDRAGKHPAGGPRSPVGTRGTVLSWTHPRQRDSLRTQAGRAGGVGRHCRR